MAYAVLTLAKGTEVRQAPLGFSWTVLLFGGIPAAFRKDWWWFAGLSLAGVASSGITSVIAAFFYNKIYARNLINNGYKVTQIPAGYTEDHVKHYLRFSVLPMFHQV